MNTSARLRARTRAPVRLALALFMAAACGAAIAQAPSQLDAPLVDHHQHLLSPQGAVLLNSPPDQPGLPPAVAKLLRAQETHWNDAEALAPLYSDDAVALDTFEFEWLQGPQEIAAHMARRFAREYDILPVAWHADERQGHLSALYSRGEGENRKNVGVAMMRFVREDDQWRIALEHPVFPGPVMEQPLDAARLVELLDAAGIQRAVVLSVGYWFQSPMFRAEDPVHATREENAWTAAQAARFPDRLVAFCSLNPISDAALELLGDCARDDRFKGLKLHFANSRADLTNPAHVERIRAVFAAANEAGLSIVVHARDGEDYGAAQARTFIEDLLPAAPDVTVQMAHLWGGAALAEDALQVYAEAVESGHPATQRLFFDASDAAFAAGTLEIGEMLAARMRQIGLDRILYGSDGAFDGHPDPQASWQAFRTAIPFTDAEFALIKSNVAPYLRD
ncbi:MAG: amidohydrolase family protein [Pseudomonadota bacterium]|nr:amidohydrolase family protein [Pseudomonadota bacterium]